MAPFIDRQDRKYVFLGVGSVAKVAAYYLEEFISVNYKNVYLVDRIDMRSVPALQGLFNRGAVFINESLEDKDWAPFLKRLDLKPYDVVIDLTTNTNAYKIIEAVRAMSLVYLNTALEINWHTQRDELYGSSILKRHHDVAKINQRVIDSRNASHVYEFGMNPGLISHFTFQALLEISSFVLQNRRDDQLAEYVSKRQFNLIARHLKLHTVHCSEMDSQVVENLPVDDTFINTWSVLGLLEEGCDPAQAGWGSHEKQLPSDGKLIGKNNTAMKTPSIHKYHISYVPNEEIIGVVIPHGEAVTINEALTAGDYCPTVHYVYKLCKQTRNLLDTLTFDQLNNVTKWRVVNPFDDKLKGEDKVGALLIFPENPITGEKKPWTYWFGSIKGQGSSKFFGPTVIQVGVGVLSALKYIVENPNLGPMYPEALPTDFILRHSVPFLGKVVSEEMNWSPVSTQYTDLEAEALKRLSQKNN